MPIAVSVCLRHKCLLINHCLECNEETPIAAIVKTRCTKCRTDLTAFKALSVLDDEIGLLSQFIIQTWFLDSTTPESTAFLLPEQPPAILFRVVDGLQSSARMLRWLKWPFLYRLGGEQHNDVQLYRRASQTLTPYESFCLYTTAFSGIMNWPEGFFEFLHAYQYKRPGSAWKFSSLRDALGSLYGLWLRNYWLHPEFDFVQKAFERYLADSQCLNNPAKSRAGTVLTTKSINQSACVPISSERDLSSRVVNPFMTVLEGAKILGTNHAMIELLLRNGQLTPITTGDNDCDKLLLLTDVLDFYYTWNVIITLEETAKILGTTEQRVVSLAKIGLLPAEQSPADGFLHWAFTRSIVLECLEKVSNHVKDCSIRVIPEERLYLDIEEASKWLFPVGMTFASLLLKVSEGWLAAYHPVNQRFQLESLLFTHFDIQAYLEAIKTGNCWIGPMEVTTLLGIKDATLAKWVKDRLLSPVTVHEHVEYFDQATIGRFVLNFIPLEEAAIIVGEETSTVQRWVRTNVLSGICISGPGIDGNYAYIFDKEGLVLWRNERLTFTEAIQLIGVNKAVIDQWCMEGKLVPLKNMSTKKQNWFLKQQFLDLNAEAIALSSPSSPYVKEETSQPQSG